MNTFEDNSSLFLGGLMNNVNFEMAHTSVAAYMAEQVSWSFHY